MLGHYTTRASELIFTFTYISFKRILIPKFKNLYMKRYFFFLMLGFLLIPGVFAANINPFLFSEPVKIEKTQQHWVVGTESILYILSSDGNLVNFLNTRELTDFLIDEDRIIITQRIQDFPNVQAYTFPELKPLWKFEPKMRVFDINLLWEEKETKTWRVKTLGNFYAIASGHKFYILNKNGKFVKQFQTENDVWDFEEIDGKYYLGSQDGNIYVLNQDLEMIEKIKVCRDFKIINPLTNQTQVKLTRSVWQIENGLGICEDGSVWS